MNKNKTSIIIALILVIVVGVIYYATRPSMIPLTVVPDTSTPTVKEDSKKVCYLQTTTGENNMSDHQFVSISYGTDNTVSGVINWLPAEKDSLVGSYTGTIETNTGMAEYPSRITVISTNEGEGILSKQQEMFIVSATSIKQAIGDKVQDADGVWKFKDISKVTYPNSPIQVTDCSTVAERFSKDYIKS